MGETLSDLSNMYDDCCENCDEMRDKIEFLQEMLKNLEQRVILLEKSKVE
jgi:hypothetical protein